MQVGYIRNHSTAIVFTLCVAYLISSDDGSIISIFVQINILEGRAGYVIMGRVLVTISHSSCCLTTETEKNIYQWKQFYWEFSCIKIQYVAQRGKQM